MRAGGEREKARERNEKQTEAKAQKPKGDTNMKIETRAISPRVALARRSCINTNWHLASAIEDLMKRSSYSRAHAEFYVDRAFDLAARTRDLGPDQH